MNDDLEQLDWINARNRNRPTPRKVEPPKIDKEISEIVGKPIFVNDRQLIKLIVKWKREKQGGEDDPDEFLKDGARIEELKRVFNPERFGLEPLNL